MGEIEVMGADMKFLKYPQTPHTVALHARADEVAQQLETLLATQRETPAGTPEWWDLQRTIAAARKDKALAEIDFYEAVKSPAEAGSTLHQHCDNRLYFLYQQLGG